MGAHTRVSVDCYVRATADVLPVDEIISTARTYEEEGLLTEAAVEFWPTEIRLTDETEETDIVRSYRQFQTWADDEGVSLEPAFTRRKRTSMVSDTSETVLVLPVLCLAVYNSGELVSVAPHTTETSQYTVVDALADISSLPRSSPDTAEFPPAHPVSAALAADAVERPGIHNTDE